MTNNQQHEERELPDGVERQPVKVHEAVREYVRQRSNENIQTYSQQVNEWLPDDEDERIPGESGDTVLLKLVPDVHQQVADLAGGNVRYGEVVAYYGMRAALRNGDIEKAVEFAEYTPNTVLRALQDGGGDDGSE